MFFQFTILIDIITRKVRFSAVPTPEYSLTGFPVYTNAPRKNIISRKGVELLTNMDRITTTMIIADLHHENILNMQGFSYD